MIYELCDGIKKKKSRRKKNLLKEDEEWTGGVRVKSGILPYANE